MKKKHILKKIQYNKSNLPIGINSLTIKELSNFNVKKVVSIDFYETKRFPVYTFYKEISRFI